jgi:D-3-phosphoglycerate dehydrogenase
MGQLKVIASNTTTRPETDPPVDGQLVWLNDPEFLENITSTAEHTLGLIMAVHRRLPHAHWSTWTEWNRYARSAPKMLSRSNLTIWGPGRVGTHLFDRAAPLFKTVWTIGENDRDEYINKTLEYTDVLALTLSCVGKQPVVTRDKLERLPKQAIVVNTARGEVLDHEALLHLLNTGHLWGAALDVLPNDHRFQYKGYDSLANKYLAYTKKSSHLILTPHMAGSTEDAWNMTQRYIIDRVKEILI